jgi:ABC-type branched-subunit amino acid transport system substrate-binding protein
LALCIAAALAFAIGLAHAEEPEFHIGVVASVTGPFAAPTKDTFDGFNAWMKQHGLPGKKIVLQTLDDETNPVNAANAFRKLASDPQTALIYLFINSNSAMAAKSFASEFKVPIITGGGADVLGVPADPWMFKVAPSNRDYMIALSESSAKATAGSRISSQPTRSASTITPTSKSWRPSTTTSSSPPKASPSRTPASTPSSPASASPTLI